MKIIALVPARMGSQRLTKKNLRLLNGIPLVTRALKKCNLSQCFSEVWLNSEDLEFKNIAHENGCFFHQRPVHLGSNTATSEDYIFEFLSSHDCDYLVQVHSIAPLLSIKDVQNFVRQIQLNSSCNTFLSVQDIRLECLYQDKPVNFTLSEKTNSQDLLPVQKISWSISAWNRSAFLANHISGSCATYSQPVYTHKISEMSAHVIKTHEDLQIAQALLQNISGDDLQ